MIRSVLLVDDNVIEKIAVKGMLEQYGFEADLAQNGHEAL